MGLVRVLAIAIPRTCHPALACQFVRLEHAVDGLLRRRDAQPVRGVAREAVSGSGQGWMRMRTGRW